MRNIHLRATSRGASEVRISFGNSTSDEWQLKQLHIHCAVTFTDPSTLYVYFRSHEGTAYDSLLLKTSVSTDAGVLNDIVTGFGYRYRHKYFTTMQGNYIGDDFYIDDSHVFDCSLDIPLRTFGGSETFTLSLALKNVFNEKYIESNRHYYQCFTGEPRTFEIALRGRF